MNKLERGLECISSVCNDYFNTQKLGIEKKYECDEIYLSLDAGHLC